ncbi:hypothetical protein JZO83_07650 [Enterococcus sp. DIV1298c]|uniref:DUF1433 domain-containing protein n=1 Tax=Candidatus Enterococcus mangumiae TaxID=2230878 RepID=A0ABZ2SZV7_9ENTE|nr:MULTISPECIES: hypothetical protein [unclassified Enterococcus]MBO0461624.1 hypothetical protein [Enterococcus sp. DIV1298c]MBO0490061.1 hypothetical protein [Enterococcus sp. DIV1094]
MAVIISLVMILIVMKVFINKSEERREQELLVVEKQSVQALKNTFADIAEIKFERSVKNDMTGSYGLFVTMKNTKGQSVYFSYGFWKENDDIGDYGLENEEVQKVGITTEKIKVIYTNGKEEIL